MVYIFILFISYMLFVALAAVVLLFSKLAETVVLYIMEPVFKKLRRSNKMSIDNITIIKVSGITEYKELMAKQTTEVVKYNFDRMVNYMFLVSMKAKEQQKMIITQLDICADLLYTRTVMNKDKKSNKHVH